MIKVNCLIIENQLNTVKKLNALLSKYSFLNICGTINNSTDALKSVKKLKPNLIFIAINYPLKNELELIRKIKNFNSNIEIIIMSASKKYAITAFDLNALDYLVKPITISRLDFAIEKLIEKILLKSYIKNVPINKIPCHYLKKIILISIDDIFFCYAKKDKTYIKTFKNTYLTNYTMDKLQSKCNFFRCHRSYIVNLNKSKELYPWFNGTYKIVMNDKENSELPISRSNVKTLKKLLDI